FLPIGTHYSALPRALCRWRVGRAQSRGRVAARPTAYLRATSAPDRADEEPGDEQPCDRAPVGRQRDGPPQAGRTFKARRERTACSARDPDRRGEAGGDRRTGWSTGRGGYEGWRCIGGGGRKGPRSGHSA